MTRTEIDGFNEKSPFLYLFDYLKEIFRIEKTPKQKFNEKKHEIEWKASGVKSWRELLNLD